jgi:hypothetical protein
VNASSESSIAMPPPFENMTRSIVRPSRMKHVRLVAELFGVSKQRAHQIAADDDFPEPVAEDARGRLWDRREVAGWAQVWRREKPWQ